MKKNRILSWILSIMMMLTAVFPAGVFADEEVEIQEPVAEDTVVVETVVEEEPAKQDEEPVQPAAEEQEEEKPAEAEEREEEKPAEAEAPAEEPEAVQEEAAQEEVTQEEAAPTPAAEEKVQFAQGYVRVNGGTVVYASDSKQEEKGSFTGSAIVYASVASRAADEGNTWLKITFDTKDAKNAGSPLMNGYVQFKDVKVLDAAEVQKLTESWKKANNIRSFGDKLLPVAPFAYKTAEAVEEPAVAEEPVEEVVPAKDEAEETPAVEETLSEEEPVVEEVPAEEKAAEETVTEDPSAEAVSAEDKSEEEPAVEETPAEEKEEAPTEDEPAEGETEEEPAVEETSEEVSDETVKDEASNAGAGSIVISQQPADAYVEQDATAEFTVVATGEDLTYQWQVKIGTRDWQNTGLNGAQTATLSFTAVGGYFGRQYRCVITDKNGGSVTSDAAKLIKGAAPAPVEITTQPVDVYAEANETAEFTVVATGEELTYQWQVKIGTRDWQNTSLNGAQSATLSFLVVGGYFGRQYRCIITDKNGNTAMSDAATLIKGPAPTPVPEIEITQQPVDAYVDQDATAEFTVVATGEELTYQWQVKIGTRDWQNTSLNGAQTATLSFTANGGYFGRQYRCVITDKNGNSVTSDAATLIKEFSIKLNDVIYKKETDDTLYVASYTGTAASLTIPTTVENMTVVAIGEKAFEGNETITSISLPNTITVIRTRAFAGCKNLSTMTNHD